ncbi:MAG: hypothetical protein N4A61_13275 [Pelagimonas sp.]|nr:hypothetical protein [Pelagimonas sp.]
MPTVLVFVLAGFVATVFAFVTVNLFTYAMANASFIREHGIEALRHGAIWQMVELLGWGALALLCWVTFKLCEHVLVDRYLAWSRSESTSDGSSGDVSEPAPQAKPGLAKD